MYNSFLSVYCQVLISGGVNRSTFWIHWILPSDSRYRRLRDVRRDSNPWSRGWVSNALTTQATVLPIAKGTQITLSTGNNHWQQPHEALQCSHIPENNEIIIAGISTRGRAAYLGQSHTAIQAYRSFFSLSAHSTPHKTEVTAVSN